MSEPTPSELEILMFKEDLLKSFTRKTLAMLDDFKELNDQEMTRKLSDHASAYLKELEGYQIAMENLKKN